MDKTNLLTHYFQQATCRSVHFVPKKSQMMSQMALVTGTYMESNENDSDYRRNKEPYYFWLGVEALLNNLTSRKPDPLNFFHSMPPGLRKWQNHLYLFLRHQ